jgi:hypothetical protein
VIPLNDSAFEAVDRISSRLLEAGEPDHVVESITGHLSRRMLEHYSHVRLNEGPLDRLNESGPVSLIATKNLTSRPTWQLYRLAWL